VAYEDYSHGEGTVERLHDVSKRLMDAHNATATERSERVAAAQEHADRIRAIARLRQAGPRAASASDIESAQLAAFAAEAQLELAQARASESRKVAQSGDGPGKGPRTRLVIGKLDDRVPMKFPDETALDDILKHIKQSTTSSEFPNGIPIYVDPLGLQEAEKSLTSTVQIDLEGVPLRRTLQLVLKQLGLAYIVEDGMIYITSQESQLTHLEPPIPVDNPIIEQGEKAVRGEMTLQEMKDWIELFATREKVRAMLEHGNSSDESGNRLIGFDEDIKKLTSRNDELKKKSDSLEAQVSQMRELITELLKTEREGKKPAGPRTR
jgi:hypothetical protein